MAAATDVLRVGATLSPAHCYLNAREVICFEKLGHTASY